MYWQQPRLRQWVILAQRLLPPLTAAASVGYIPAHFFELASLRYWPMVGQYVYLGWTAFMLAVSANHCQGLLKCSCIAHVGDGRRTVIERNIEGTFMHALHCTQQARCSVTGALYCCMQSSAQQCAKWTNPHMASPATLLCIG
jgi:hypothetical protein